MHRLYAALAVVVGSIALGCAPGQDTSLDTREADEAAIRAADMAWARTGEIKDLDAPDDVEKAGRRNLEGSDGHLQLRPVDSAVVYSRSQIAVFVALTVAD